MIFIFGDFSQYLVDFICFIVYNDCIIRIVRMVAMALNEGLIYTNGNCIGCNRCISGCPVLGANISVKKDGRNQIYVDDEKCLHCGRCLETCHHNAREYRDDADRFLLDLKQGVPISLLVAPSFFIIYDQKALQILGYLKQLAPISYTKSAMAPILPPGHI